MLLTLLLPSPVAAFSLRVGVLDGSPPCSDQQGIGNWQGTAAYVLSGDPNATALLEAGLLRSLLNLQLLRVIGLYLLLIAILSWLVWRDQKGVEAGLGPREQLRRYGLVFQVLADEQQLRYLLRTVPASQRPRLQLVMQGTHMQSEAFALSPSLAPDLVLRIDRAISQAKREDLLP
ncbi:MAG: hypothetical protein VKL23_05210 [Cyanobacteriota bacterium]|nr:hypothetical protein [Cyanobacteriota bacterium]